MTTQTMKTHPDNHFTELARMLKSLRLSGMLDSLDARNRQAFTEHLAPTEFLTLLIQDEVDRRDQHKLSRRLRRAAFHSAKTIEQSDFQALPTLNRATVHDLMTCRFIHEKAPVLIAGPTGTGKSHLAQAIGDIVTSNLDFDEWPQPFAENKLLGVATLDRLNHGAYQIILDAQSYRKPRPLTQKTAAQNLAQTATSEKSKKKAS